MMPKSKGHIQRVQKMNHIQGERPNWILIAGGALLSTLSIRLGCKLKQAFDARSNVGNVNISKKENGKAVAKRKPGACKSQSDLYCFSQDEDGCYHCLSGISDSAVNMKRPSMSPMSRDGELPLSLVKTSGVESNKENGGVMWSSSPDRLELPTKPSQHSNSSDSPCVSESGSDIFNKREVMQKLRQQLKRRDEMIVDMQAQMINLQTSLEAQMGHSSHLQSQLDSANRDLFDSEREIQRLRKAIADHCMAGEKPGNWRSNGYIDSMDEVELHCIGPRAEMLRREVVELKEVIEGKEMLLQSYKEQKVELSAMVKELQLRLASHVPNIL